MLIPESSSSRSSGLDHAGKTGDKDALRREAYDRRANAADTTAAEKLAQVGLEALAGLLTSGATNITGYWPVRGEIDSRCLLHRLHERGAILSLPAVGEKKQRDLEFRFWTPETHLIADTFNIPAPAPESGVMEEPDILLVPLLAFDRDGFRLGYGGGYFDSVLTRLRGSTRRRPFRLLAFGLAFTNQETEDLPREPHDQPLDGVLTPSGMIRNSKALA